jgi:type II secretory pathway component PulF
MTTYSYSAVDAQGKENRGTLHVADQAEALKQIKEMGFHPVKLTPVPTQPSSPASRARRHSARLGLTSRAVRTQYDPRPRRRVRARVITLFTR